MNIEYCIFDPCGNITALVTSHVKKENYKSVAAAIMKANPSVEQVGFIGKEDNMITLNMSGDEFCGNATICTAVLRYLDLSTQTSADVNVKVLPMNTVISVSVQKQNGGFLCNGCFEIPKNAGDYSFTYENKTYSFPLVSFNGISHIIADNSLKEESAKKVIKSLAKNIDVSALGIMLFNGETNSLCPIVYVKDVDTLFVENSCASGSCAVASVECREGEAINLIEPGGRLTLLKKNNKIILCEEVKIISKCLEEV